LPRIIDFCIFPFICPLADPLRRITSYMLSRAGAWLDGSNPVDSAAYQQFTSWVASGYELAGASLVDRAELDRSTQLNGSHAFRIRIGSALCPLF
jgi:hypothetical protein